MDLNSIAFISCLACVAFCYAAVGHGGASGYIAVFVLFGMVSPSMKSFVLLMNLAVAAISFYHYYIQGHFNLKYFIPFGLGAMPMAYIGAGFKIDTHIYQYLLAGFLLFSVVYLSGYLERFQHHFQLHYNQWRALILAMLLGFISGIIGVGGGIFLSPILLIFGWQNVKQTAAIAALFIVLNSLAGLFALNDLKLLIDQELISKLLIVTFFGYLGSKWGVKIENIKLLKRMLALVLLIAAYKLCIF
jgi:uncharacterized membrane protein YfcA